MKVKLEPIEVEKCLNFAKEFILQGKSELDFGNGNLPREDIDRIADCAEGKLGEKLFVEFCKKCGVSIGVDFSLTQGRHSIDYGQDIDYVLKDNIQHEVIPRVDIKTSRSYSNWLLIESHKMWPSILVFMTVNLPRDSEHNLSAFQGSIEGEFKGFAYWFDFFDQNNDPWFKYKVGNKLIKPKFLEEVLNDNFGITNKNQLVELIKQEIGSWDLIPTIGGPLKCPLQFGLPNFLLRNSKEDIECLMNSFKNSLIPISERGRLGASLENKQSMF